jgi:hypothetical protein
MTATLMRSVVCHRYGPPHVLEFEEAEKLTPRDRIARTFSAAEDFVVDFDAITGGVIVGEPTGGSTGSHSFSSSLGVGCARLRRAHPSSGWDRVRRRRRAATRRRANCGQRAGRAGPALDIAVRMAQRESNWSHMRCSTRVAPGLSRCS